MYDELEGMELEWQSVDICMINAPLVSWSEFRVGYLFNTLERGKNSSAADLLDGVDCFYIGAKKDDNGVMKRVAYNKQHMTTGNCIIFIGNGQGSVGYTNYMDVDFIGTSDITVGYNENLNEYVGMFLVTVFDLERTKYSFGRKWSARIADTVVKLPSKQHRKPNWKHLETHIKALPYGDII